MMSNLFNAFNQYGWLLQTSMSWLLVSTAALAACLGSFLNVVIVRLPQRLQQDWQRECDEWLKLLPAMAATQQTVGVWQPRSHCIHCQTRFGLV